MDSYRHYITVDNTRITDVFTTAFRQPEDGDICINENGGRLPEFAPINSDGLHLYRYENEQVRKATEAELAAELEELQAAGLGETKAVKITESKTQLAAFLEAHPLTYTNRKQYSVTAEKQSLLTSALARYQIAAAAGIRTELKWNATGEECTVWEYADLATLALAIAAYVEPLVAQQQAVEVAVNACATVAEVEAIEVAYRT